MSTNPTTVLVTGATGYVAGGLIHRLLHEGHRVHAAVRDPDNKDKLKYLNHLAEQEPGEIHYFKANLLEPGSYAEAMAGCSVVFHTASPFVLRVKDPQKDLVDPAQLGTRNVLEQADKTPEVSRVVVTSSCAAVYGDNRDMASAKGDGTLTEADWNTTSSLHHSPYSYSKTLAEREAWKIAEAQDRWRLVVVNPSLVIGPALNPFATSESFTLIRHLGDGKLMTGVPNYPIGAVDVRDVAQVHMHAGFHPNAAGRYITSGHDTSLAQMGELLKKKFRAYPFPLWTLPKWLVWLVGPIADPTLTRRTIENNVDMPLRLDNSKTKREFGMTYRPLDESLEEMFQQMIDNGIVRKR